MTRGTSRKYGRAILEPRRPTPAKRKFLGRNASIPCRHRTPGLSISVYIPMQGPAKDQDSQFSILRVRLPRDSGDRRDIEAPRVAFPTGRHTPFDLLTYNGPVLAHRDGHCTDHGTVSVCDIWSSEQRPVVATWLVEFNRGKLAKDGLRRAGDDS